MISVPLTGLARGDYLAVHSFSSLGRFLKLEYPRDPVGTRFEGIVFVEDPSVPEGQLELRNSRGERVRVVNLGAPA